MEETFWKVSAIVFFILFVIILTYNIWAISLYLDEEGKIAECYYDICKDYGNAIYENNVCGCYEPDLMGGWAIAKETYMK